LKVHGEAEATTGTRTLEEIVESVQKTEKESEQKSVSRQEAYHGFDCLRRYVQENARDSELVKNSVYACQRFESDYT
jgi:hypothetical protein